MGDRHTAFGLLHQRLVKGNIFIQKGDEQLIEEMRNYSPTDSADAMVLAIGAGKVKANLDRIKSMKLEHLIYYGT